MTGYIPKTVTIYQRDNKEKVSSWKFDFILSGIQPNDLEIFPSMVVPDKAKSSSHSTAKKWAGYNNKLYTSSVVPNDPQEYRLLNLKIRSEGGRAWKVVDSQERYFDLREDSLLFSLLNDGCKPNGTLARKLIWGVCGSQTKLIPVDSPIHTSLLKLSEDKEAKRNPHASLQPGWLYKEAAGGYAIYVGPVNYLTMDTSNYAYSYVTGYQIKVNSVKEMTNGQAWLSLLQYKNETFQDLIKRAKQYLSRMDTLTLVKDKKVIEEIEFIDDIKIDEYVKQNNLYKYCTKPITRIDQKPMKDHMNLFAKDHQKIIEEAIRLGVYYV